MRVNWREEEIRLLLTYYRKMNSGDMHKTHPLVLKASKAIRDLDINKEYSSQSEKFRNPNGVALKLANFLFLDPSYEGKGMKGCSALDRKIFNEENKEIGRVTSGTFGPSVDHPISMGYVDNNYSPVNTKIFLEIRGKKVSANICKLPFYQKNYVKEI